MANENRYYKTPFAESGNKAEIPDVSTGGSVGYDTGYGPDYELAQGSASRKRIERDLYNGMFNGVTGNLKQWQENLYPTWIEDNGFGDAFPYNEGMIVNHEGVNYISLEDLNQEEPGTGSKWVVQDNSLSTSYAFKSVVDMTSSLLSLPVGAKVSWRGYYAESDGGSNWGTVKSGAHVEDGGEIFTLADGKYVEANLKGKMLSVQKYGAIGDGVSDHTVNIQKAVAKAEYFVNRGQCQGISFAGGWFIISDTIQFKVPMIVKGGNASLYAETLNGDLFYVNAGGSTAGFIRSHFKFEDFTLAGGPDCDTFHINAIASSTFNSIHAPFCRYGFVVENSLLNNFKNCIVSGISVNPNNPYLFYDVPSHRNRKGFFLYAGAVTGPNANTFTQCGAQNSTEEAIRNIGGNNSHFIDFDSEGHTGNHLYSDGCINLQFTGGDFEGTSELVFNNCVGGGVKGAFVNHIVRVEGVSNSVKIEGGLIKIIDIADSTCDSTVVDDVTLYTGASGFTDSGTNTRIGRIYDQDTNSPYSGREWTQTGGCVIDVGGTTTGHTITRNNLTVQRQNNFYFLNLSLTWSSLAGTGEVAFDCSEFINSITNRASMLSMGDLRVTLPSGFTSVSAKMREDGMIRLRFEPDASGTVQQVTKADLFGGNNGLTISGIVSSIA